jgi:NAD(P)-dependent dehydrogenase (short-subunit alcohol dehydrogenase family)
MTPHAPASTLRPTVLVTGAARRIGRAIALDLARAGFDLALHYRRSEGEAQALAAELRALGARAECFAADLADEAACRSLVPAVARRMQRIDAVVNNASHFAYDDARGFTMAAMDAHWRANTAPAVLLAGALAAHLEGCSEVGCVVNLLGPEALEPEPRLLLATRCPRRRWTRPPRCWRWRWRRACAWRRGPGRDAAVRRGDDDAGFAAAHRMTPLGRSSTPEDVARAVRYVLESPAVTGTTLLVDGGQHLARQSRDVAFLTPKV